MGHSIYYRDVHVFVSSIRNIVSARSDEKVRHHVHASLRGPAAEWYAMELTDFEKEALRNTPAEAGWIPQLMTRFQPNPAKAMNDLENLRYGKMDVIAGKTPTAYTQEIIQAAGAAGITVRWSQLLLAWTHLDPYYKKVIPKPNPGTQLSDWMTRIEEYYLI